MFRGWTTGQKFLALLAAVVWIAVFWTMLFP
jgi:hypothetical protein